ncbi:MULTISPECIES: Bug family tripartite tricarboxylate transporter substrate binding protein [unclassified Cupriavidus]|uniref:Bug family tripartite tricarboxylate transporter substrate binding protein n=1 Tax=unclassified Cupriavidus TaxID=2640874 RepID=UPI00088208D4|nr:tripartite tricarboxylate transporter substrate binding protein [Cupriavidus sp. YR651]SDC63201.1 Tripartite-type tricarboxylate transporter, receptor component TctC [Cupriavidus sp. YR651]
MTQWQRTLVRGALALSALAAGIATTAPAYAADKWPSKPITWVVPFAAGGSTDIVARSIGQELSRALGQPVVVENRPGAAGAVGAGYVARAKPDGYTLFGGTISTHAINASLYKNLSYDPVKDFEPVSLVGYVPNVLMVNADLPVKTVQELIAYAKKQPGKLSFASSGAGTSTHLAGELFADLIHVPMTHVPYKGSPQAVQDVAAGLVPFLFDQLTAGDAMIRAGRLRPLAVTSPKRSALLPNVPTMAEAGVSGFEMVSWQALYAPHGTPRAIVDRLNAEVVRALKQPAVQERLSKSLGMEVVGSSPEELAALMSKEIPRWAALVKKSGASAE